MNRMRDEVDEPQTLVNRLRGIYPAWVEGQYKTAPIQHEAARRIEELEAELRLAKGYALTWRNGKPAENE